MALTVFETAEQLQSLPCHGAAEQGDGGKAVEDGSGGGDGPELAVLLQEPDRGGDDDRPEADDVWSMIQQAQRPVAAAVAAAVKQQAVPYVHPLVRRSSSLLSQKSLEICTESLGSETGSDGFSDSDGSTYGSCRGSEDDSDEGAKEVVAARASPPRAFPPPLPSLARRAVGAVQMRQDRRDGRLIVKAVPVPSGTLFRAQRCGGRLLLSFADTAAPTSDEDENHGEEPQQHANELPHDEVEDDEEEVEVVDRGTVVEVKVSTHPQARSNGGDNRTRVHRSSLVINKFVNAEPAIATSDISDDAAPATAIKHPRRPTVSTSTTTAAAALAAASALSATSAPSGGDGPGKSKLLMTTCSRWRSKEELMNHMRRCGQLNGKLFVFEARNIATSS